MQAEPSIDRYDSFTVFFHWAVAALVVEQWLGAQLIDVFAGGAPRINARSVHILLGIALGFLLLARIVWRMTRGKKLEAAETGLLQIAAVASHWMLYALLVAIIPVGLFLVWVRGENIFGLFHVPAFDPDNRVLRHNVGELHGIIANAILLLASLHAGAALVHHYLLQDNVLRRMLPDRE